MKLKKHAFLLILGLFAASLFAQENQEDNGQLLSVEAEEASAEENSTEENSAEKVDSDAYEEVIPAETKKKSSFSESVANFFKIGNQAFIEYDTTELSVLNPVGTLKKEDAVFACIKDTDQAGFGCQYISGFYYVFLDTDSRKKLIDAGNQYFKDFENKKLDRKSKKTQQKYGKVKSDVYFGSLKMQAKNHAQPVTYYGYSFKKNSPYFTITCMAAQNLRYTSVDDIYPVNSTVVVYYFTKAQLKNLMNLLSEENLNSYKANTLMNSYLTEEEAY
ncbi:MAG: hypothetical protein K6G09_10900 [Treponema sp.]|nr:hypothetical protein [Treponema sp.]